jgi:hypothetical protein
MDHELLTSWKLGRVATCISLKSHPFPGNNVQQFLELNKDEYREMNSLQLHPCFTVLTLRPRAFLCKLVHACIRGLPQQTLISRYFSFISRRNHNRTVCLNIIIKFFIRWCLFRISAGSTTLLMKVYVVFLSPSKEISRKYLLSDTAASFQIIDNSTIIKPLAAVQLRYWQRR